jgi:hypothetical protein
VRVILESFVRPRNADLGEKLHNPVPRSFLRQPHVLADRLTDLVADGQGRIEARERILEDEPDLLAAQLAHRLVAE